MAVVGAVRRIESGAFGWKPDQFHFVYQELRGDIRITAQLSESAIDREVGDDAMFGVMLRESLAPGGVILRSADQDNRHQTLTTPLSSALIWKAASNRARV